MPASATTTPRWGRRVRQQVYDHVFAHPEGEVGGVLVGSLGDDDRLRVAGAIPALRANGRRASVTFTHDAWSEIHATMERKFRSDQRIVGWYHSHPGFGIFLSEHDLFIHRNFFSDDCQIAFVIDPFASTEGIFAWRDGEVEKLFERRTPRERLETPHAKADEPRSSRRVTLAARITMALIGVLIGVTLWFAALRLDSGVSQNHASPTRIGHATSVAPGKSRPSRYTANGR